MSIVRTNNLQNPDSSGNNIELTQNGGTIVSGVSTFSSGLNVTSGNVGIGTDNPITKLQVVGTSRFDLGSITTEGPFFINGNKAVSNGAIVHVRNDGVDGTHDVFGGIKFSSSPGSDFVLGKNSRYGTGYFQIRNQADTPLLTISGNGNIGIGTDNPGYKLDVRPTPVDPTTGSPPSESFLQIRADDATVGYGPSLSLMNLGGTKETGWRISAVSTSGNNGDLTFHGYAGGATYPEAARFTSAGNLKFPSGQGIDFSATGGPANGTGTSELLNDYEEGTWTPAAFLSHNPSGTKTVSTGSSPTGQYVKVGKVVTAWFYLPYTLSGTGSYNMGVNGLPFTADTALATVCGGARESSATGTWYQCESITGTTIQVLRRYDNGAAYDGTASMFGFVTYRAAS